MKRLTPKLPKLSNTNVKEKDDDVFRLCYEKYGKNELSLEIVNGIHRFIASVR
jgi:hypothetical protein